MTWSRRPMHADCSSSSRSILLYAAVYKHPSSAGCDLLVGLQRRGAITKLLTVDVVCSRRPAGQGGVGRGLCAVAVAGDESAVSGRPRPQSRRRRAARCNAKDEIKLSDEREDDSLAVAHNSVPFLPPRPAPSLASVYTIELYILG